MNLPDGAFCEIRTKSIAQAPARFFCAFASPPPTPLDVSTAALRERGIRVHDLRRGTLRQRIYWPAHTNGPDRGSKSELLRTLVAASSAKAAGFGVPSSYRGGAPDTIRTCDLCLRRATLYPAELRVREGSFSRLARGRQRPNRGCFGPAARLERQGVRRSSHVGPAKSTIRGYSGTSSSALVLSPAAAGLSKLTRAPEFAQGSSIFVENQLGATYAAGCTTLGGVHHKGL